MVLLVALVSVLIYLVAQRLDDRSPGGTTTARTASVPGPSVSLTGMDLGGGTIHHRSGNQP
jgi:hypothetical protein